MTWTRIALVLYCLLAIVQIRQKPGLQYDEALAAIGTVHMRHHPREPFTLPHDPDTWIHIRTRWLPLMTVRYVGAVKEYLWLPVLKIFGPSTSSIRVLSVLLGMLGIWGVAALLRAFADARVAGFTALVLAINPTYVAMTTFDNGTVSIFMASLGMVCAALVLYQRRGVPWAAFLVGLAMGFGVWARVNFAWVLGAMFVAAAVVLRRKLLEIPWRHWIAAASGGVIGGAPLIVYQILSHGGTFEAVGMFSANDTLGARLFTRLVMFSESLISDREHRVMWEGPPLAPWQPWLFGAVVLAACGFCLRSGGLRRIIAIAFLIFAACLFFTRLPVAEHHLVALLPFAAAMVVLALAALIERIPRGRAIAGALAAVYLGCALQAQMSAVAELRRTGGAGVWSDGVVKLAMRLENNHANLTPDTAPAQKAGIKFLDWGFQQNMYVITGSRLPTVEIFGDATAEKSGLNRTWMEEIRAGGVFVLFPPELRQMPLASTAFLNALRETAPVTRRYSITRRDGAPYAEVIEVQPNTLHQGLSAKLSTGDPAAAERFEGFHQIESGWRWSKPNFAISLDAPPVGSATAARLSIDLYLPDTLIGPLGPITLSGKVNGHNLQPETYGKPGSFTLIRELPVSWLREGLNRVEFTLDKSLHAGERELGVVVSSAALEPVK